MKLTTIIVLALGTLVAAEASNVVNRGLDCKKAEQSYDFCVKARDFSASSQHRIILIRVERPHSWTNRMQVHLP